MMWPEFRSAPGADTFGRVFHRRRGRQVPLHGGHHLGIGMRAGDRQHQRGTLENLAGLRVQAVAMTLPFSASASPMASGDSRLASSWSHRC